MTIGNAPAQPSTRQQEWDDTARTVELEKEIVREISVPVYRTIHTNGIEGTYMVADTPRTEEAFDLVFKALIRSRKRVLELERELAKR